MSPDRARPDVWVKAMLKIVATMLVILLIFGAAMIVGAVALRNATDTVNNASQILNRRSVVLETTDCSVRSMGDFLDTIGKLIQLDRANVSERIRLFADIDRVSAQMRACASTPGQVKEVEKVTRDLKKTIRTSSTSAP